LSHVTLAVVSNAEIEREVATETKRLTSSQFNNHRFADHFLRNVMMGQAGTYAALYSTSSQTVMVSDSLLRNYVTSVGDDAESIKQALQALLTHELVHAADDSKYGIHRDRHLNFRASFTQSAVYEGHAQFLTRRICRQENCISGLRALDFFMFGDTTPPNQLSQPVQAVSRNILEYSYVEGERFIASLARRENGSALIKDALAAPPIDPIQILDVETSPLKGVNLRSDPERRTAAVDGFTRLIRGMVALQHYDQSELGQSPIEVTLMTARTDQTAEMFSRSLTSNLLYNSGGEYKETLLWLDPVAPIPVNSVSTVLDDGSNHLAVVISEAEHVVQIVGVNMQYDDAIAYAKEVLLNLTAVDASGA